MNERWLKRSGEERGGLLNSQIEDHNIFEALNVGEDF